MIPSYNTDAIHSEGKIKHIGLCEVSSTALRRAFKIAPVAAVQCEYSPFVRDLEGESGTNLLQTCRELGIAIVCYSPLGRSLLTGNLSTREAVTAEAGDIRGKDFPWFSEENIDANAKVVGQFKACAEKKGCSASQLALAWIVAQGENFFPIPGTRKIKYLEDNWGALGVKLTKEEVDEVRKFVESTDLAGYRSVPEAKYFAYVDTKEESK